MDSAIQFKNNLISRIRNSNDLKFLKALQTIFDSSEQELYELNEAQKESINISRDEIKNGNYIESSKAISDIKEWLKKK
ncbi:MAG: hypothetical protein K9J13_15170 [Saprospiraceae bacterium]|nr:hypothetical protein [Saprospiraceae bacterium]